MNCSSTWASSSLLTASNALRQLLLHVNRQRFASRVPRASPTTTTLLPPYTVACRERMLALIYPHKSLSIRADLSRLFDSNCEVPLRCSRQRHSEVAIRAGLHGGTSAQCLDAIREVVRRRILPGPRAGSLNRREDDGAGSTLAKWDSVGILDGDRNAACRTVARAAGGAVCGCCGDLPGRERSGAVLA